VAYSVTCDQIKRRALKKIELWKFNHIATSGGA